jgi:hypothetical protein
MNRVQTEVANAKEYAESVASKVGVVFQVQELSFGAFGRPGPPVL